MNQLHSSLSSAEREGARSRFARQVVACLDEDANRVPSDVTERLRFARERAIERAQLARSRPRPLSRFSLAGAGALIGGGSTLWLKLASVVPLAVLVGGLVLIQQWETKTQISVAAEVDAALLADDLPPTAYRDPAFFEFLKSPHE